MKFTYTDPASDPKDAVRLSVGDTNERAPFLFDEEIAVLLTASGGNVSSAASLACEAIIAKLSRLCDQSIGGVSKSYSQMLAGYYQLRDTLKVRGAYRGGLPIAGGMSRTAEITQDRDRDRLRPQYTTRMAAPRRVRDGRYGRGSSVTYADPTLPMESDWEGT